MKQNVLTSIGLGRISSLIISVSLIAIITILHYVTPTALPLRHEIYYRLYYIPIILSAFSFGLTGGIVSAIVVSLVIFPHILIDWGGLIIENLNMLIEILLYNIIGLLTGFLVSSDKRKRRELEEARSRLEDSFKELERRGERLMQVEESLRAHEKLALVGEMAAVMAHEVRNPLGSIQGAAEIISDKVEKEGEVWKYTSILVSEVRRLNDVVTGLIDSAKPREKDKIPIQVNDILKDLVYLYSQSAKKRGIQVLENYQEGLPRVLVNEDMMRQVLINVS